MFRKSDKYFLCFSPLKIRIFLLYFHTFSYSKFPVENSGSAGMQNTGFNRKFLHGFRFSGC